MPCFGGASDGEEEAPSLHKRVLGLSQTASVPFLVSGPYPDMAPSAPPMEVVDESGRLVSWRGNVRGPGGARLKLMQVSVCLLSLKIYLA